MNDHRSYAHNLSSCVNYAWKQVSPGRYITNSQSDQLQVGRAQLVEQRTGIADVMGSVEAWIFFRFSFHNCTTIMIKCLHKDGRQNKVECRCNAQFLFFFFFSSFYLQIATAFSDMYSVIFDASHNPLHADNKMAVTFFERNFSRINLVWKNGLLTMYLVYNLWQVKSTLLMQ